MLKTCLKDLLYEKIMTFDLTFVLQCQYIKQVINLYDIPEDHDVWSDFCSTVEVFKIEEDEKKGQRILETQIWIKIRDELTKACRKELIHDIDNVLKNYILRKQPFRN